MIIRMKAALKSSYVRRGQFGTDSTIFLMKLLYVFSRHLFLCWFLFFDENHKKKFKKSTWDRLLARICDAMVGENCSSYCDINVGRWSIAYSWWMLGSPVEDFCTKDTIGLLKEFDILLLFRIVHTLQRPQFLDDFLFIVPDWICFW